MSEIRRYCRCGATVVARSSSPGWAEGVAESFDQFHLGEGHGPATLQQAGRARRGAAAAELKLIPGGEA